MSIQGDIQRLVSEGRLIKVLSEFDLETELRSLYITSWLQEELTKPSLSRDEQQRLQGLRVDLEVFVYSKTLDSGHLKALRGGKGVLEIRSTYPQPQLRVFGGLADLDTLILFRYRDRGELDRQGQAAWNSAIRQVQRSWRSLLGPNSAPRTEPLGALVTGYISEEIPP